MVSKQWRTSQRQYEMVVERDVRIPVRDGTILVGDIFRPRAAERFPVILGAHPYSKELQTSPLRPIGYGNLRGYMESGDPAFYVRRGYVHAVVNVRGTGKSQGTYPFMGPLERQDVCDVISWLAGQPWSDGNVGMFGVSYFSWLQQQVAALNPPHLKAIFAPFGATDFYRDVFYHGGILAHAFLLHWTRNWDNPRTVSWFRERFGEAEWRKAIARALQDEDIIAVPELKAALEAPEDGLHPVIVDVLLNPLDGEFYQERNVRSEDARVPAYLGGGWGIYGLHLPGAFRSWSRWQGPKKLVIGPALYLDRPVYQYQYESLRWFDHWLKGMDNGIMEEPAVRLFLPPTGRWVTATEWPLPETRWTPFFLHAGGLLSEHEFWPDEGNDLLQDSTFVHGALTYYTPPLVEETEITGPLSVTLYISATDPEPLLFATLLLVDREGTERELTRGWLRVSQRKLVEGRPFWEVDQSHDERAPLEPGSISEVTLSLVPTCRLCLPGEQIGLRIKGADDEPAHNRLEQLARGHVWRQSPWQLSIYHDTSHPSCLNLPVTRGNLIGTFLSGGQLPDMEPGVKPYAKIHMPKTVE